jgi:hypothetical protein
MLDADQLATVATSKSPSAMVRNIEQQIATPSAQLQDVLHLLPNRMTPYVGTPLYAGLDVCVEVTDDDVQAVPHDQMSVSDVDALDEDLDCERLQEFFRTLRVQRVDRLLVCGRWHPGYLEPIFAGNRCLWFRGASLVATRSYDADDRLFPFDWLGSDLAFHRSFNCESQLEPVTELTEAVLGIYNMRGPRITFDGILWIAAGISDLPAFVSRVDDPLASWGRLIERGDMPPRILMGE